MSASNGVNLLLKLPNRRLVVSLAVSVHLSKLVPANNCNRVLHALLPGRSAETAFKYTRIKLTPGQLCINQCGNQKKRVQQFKSNKKDFYMNKNLQYIAYCCWRLPRSSSYC